jgi:hypothetical protein
MRLIDAHSHAANGGKAPAALATELAQLQCQALDHLVLIMSPNFGYTTAELQNMYPPEGQTIAQRSDLLELRLGVEVAEHLVETEVLLPFLGFQTFFRRAMAGESYDEVRATIAEHEGFIRGFKLHYFRPGQGTSVTERLVGSIWDQDRFDRFADWIVGEAVERDLPVLVHVDLRDAMDPFLDLIRSHPGARICLCHLGYSRRLCAVALDELPDPVTDISGIPLHAAMATRLDDYREFITAFSDRVLYGSDQYLGDLPALGRAWQLVEELKLDQPAADAVRLGNARRFLRLGDGKP